MNTERTKRRLASIVTNIISINNVFGYSIEITEANKNLGFTGANLALKRDVPLGVNPFFPHENKNIAVEMGIGSIGAGGAGIFVQGRIIF